MELLEALTQLGAIPKTAQRRAVGDSSPVGGLTEVWRIRREATRGAAGAKAERVVNWLQSQHSAGAVVELRQPSPHGTLEAAFGARVLWWPRGRPDGRRIAIVSSRIGRRFHERPELFTALRLATAALDEGDSLITSPGTTTHPFVLRLSELLDLPLIEIRFASPRLPAERWFDWLTKEAINAAGNRLSTVFVSPPIQFDSPSQRVEVSESAINRLDTAPDRDLAVHLLADQMWVLSLRSRGFLQEILATGLAETTFKAGSLRLLSGEGLVENALARPLEELGAVRWILSSADDVAAGDSLDGRNPPSDDAPAIASQKELTDWRGPGDESEWSWLTHCTRHPRGAWPDETESDHLDELLLSESSERSPLAALRRILEQDRLFASENGIRGGFDVVCFSARPLEELLRRREWQRHRTRWDFEPYGICIRCGLLKQFGARPVEYGDDESWNLLAEQDRPWFQKRVSEIGARTVDWSTEDEWRIRGDLDLSQIDSDDAFVFVPTESEANEIRAISPWPVAVVASDR